jgi:hypothetical protein
MQRTRHKIQKFLEFRMGDDVGAEIAMLHASRALLGDGVTFNGTLRQHDKAYAVLTARASCDAAIRSGPALQVCIAVARPSRTPFPSSLKGRSTAGWTSEPMFWAEVTARCGQRTVRGRACFFQGKFGISEIGINDEAIIVSFDVHVGYRCARMHVAC